MPKYLVELPKTGTNPQMLTEMTGLGFCVNFITGDNVRHFARQLGFDSTICQERNVGYLVLDKEIDERAKRVLEKYSSHVISPLPSG